MGSVQDHYQILCFKDVFIAQRQAPGQGHGSAVFKVLGGYLPGLVGKGRHMRTQRQIYARLVQRHMAVHAHAQNHVVNFPVVVNVFFDFPAFLLRIGGIRVEHPHPAAVQIDAIKEGSIQNPSGTAFIGRVITPFVQSDDPCFAEIHFPGPVHFNQPLIDADCRLPRGETEQCVGLLLQKRRDSPGLGIAQLFGILINLKKHTYSPFLRIGRSSADGAPHRWMKLVYPRMPNTDSTVPRTKRMRISTMGLHFFFVMSQ